MQYLDYELEIGPGRGREYAVTLIRSPAGEAYETMCFPFDEIALEKRLLALEKALLRSDNKRRRIISSEEQVIQDFGQALFKALLVGELRNCYYESLREATRQSKGLRLKMRFRSPELAVLPWEYLYDEREGEYLCLSRKTPIIRYPLLSQPTHPLTVAPPLHILGMIASPHDLPPLDADREKMRVERAVKGLISQGLVDLTWLPGQGWRDLKRAMRRGPWHIFHFIGHGGFDIEHAEGLIALANEEGEKQFLSARQVGLLLANHSALRLVILNACEGARGSEGDIFSSTGATLVRRGVSAVIAMQHEITDRAAIEFAREFYEAVSDGMPVDSAVAEARLAISLALRNTVEWGTPVLYMRSPNGILFNLTKKQTLRKKKRTLVGHMGEVTSLAFSSDGEILASGSEDGIVRLWRVSDGSFLHIFEENLFSVKSLAFSRDGANLACASGDAAVHLWHFSDGKLFRISGDQFFSVTSAAFSTGGENLALGREDGTVRLLHVLDGEPIGTLQEGGLSCFNPVFSLAFSPDGTTLASGSRDHFIRLWQVHDGQLMKTLKGHTDWVLSLAFSPDGATLASGSRDNSIRLWRISNGQPTCVLGGHTAAVKTVIFSPDGRTLASGSHDRTLRLWRVPQGQQARMLKGHTDSVKTVAFSPDGTTLASGSRDYTVRLWDEPIK